METWSGWKRVCQLSWFIGFFADGLLINRLLKYSWPMPGKIWIDDANYFGAFADVPIPPGVALGQIGAMREQAAISKS